MGWKYFHTDLAAAKFLATHQQVSLRSLKKNKKKVSRVSEFVSRFKILQRIYTNPSCPKEAMPNDLETAIECGKKHPDFALKQPGLHLLLLAGKDGVWKDALMEAWSVARSNGSLRSVRSLQSLTREDLDAQIDVLLAACHELDNCDKSLWNANVGRKNLFHAGWLQLMTKFFSILQTVKRGGLRLSKAFQYGPCRNRAEARARLQVLHKAGCILNKLSTPSSLTQWHAVFTEAMKYLRKVGPPGFCKRGGYSMQ